MNLVQWLLGYVVLMGIIGALLGCIKGRPGIGAFGSVLLGPLGWLLVLLWRDERPKCPACKGVVAKDASRCRHCGAALGFDPAAYERAKTVAADRQTAGVRMPDGI